MEYIAEYLSSKTEGEKLRPQGCELKPETRNLKLAALKQKTGSRYLETGSITYYFRNLSCYWLFT
jgi:hypothetical protein